MVGQVVTACCGHRLKLMVRETMPEITPRCGERIEKDIVGVVHLIDPEDGLEAAFIKAGVVRHNRVVLYEGLDVRPDIREDRCMIGVLRTEAVNLLAEPLIVLWLRMNEAVVGIHYHSTPDDYRTNATYAGGAFVRRLEINSQKGIHNTRKTIIC